MNLLKDLVVVDFSQFLSGPSASLRLADLGASVIKVEKKGTGDICRQLYVSDVVLEGDSTIFHAINRNKKSYAADLKDQEDLSAVRKLLQKADVMIHNFRPGVMERLGLDYASVRQINPSIIYGAISGYGEEGPWKDLPGQDLLLQSLSGLTWLSGNQEDPPTPMGVAVVDIVAGTHLAQGLLAAVYHRKKTGQGALVQVNMLESILDFQFEVFTCFLNDGHQLPQRSLINNGNAYVAAPYGIYRCKDGFLALAMCDLPELGKLLEIPALLNNSDKSSWFRNRDEIKEILAHTLLEKTVGDCLGVLEPADIWCARVLNYQEMREEAAYVELQMEMTVRSDTGLEITTTRCPIRVNGERLISPLAAPQLGQHNAWIDRTFSLRESTE